MIKNKPIKHQNEKIQYHDVMVGFYQDMKKYGGARLSDDEIDNQIAYHERLVVYHRKRRGLINSGG